MALFSKSLDAARNDVAKAQATVDEWEAKASAVRAQAKDLDARSGALILEDEAQAEKISLDIQSMERKARAFDGAVSDARRKLAAAQRKVLEAAQADEERLAEQAQKKHEAHEKAVDSLLAQLKELNGCDYIIGPSEDSWKFDNGANQLPKSRDLNLAILKHSTRAAVIKYFLKTGKVPAQNYDLNTELGTSFSTLASSINEVDGFPPIVFEFRDSGIAFETVGV